MTLNEIKKIEELYLLKSDSFKSEQYEIQIIEGFGKEIQWSLLSDSEKFEVRKRELRKRHAFKELYSDSIILYEESVVTLIDLIMSFLGGVNDVVFNNDEMSEEEFLLFRLKNMLYIELYAVNKRLKLKYAGHVLFEEVVEPIFIEIENTRFYAEYKLEKIKETYKFVSDLHKKDPYKK